MPEQKTPPLSDADMLRLFTAREGVRIFTEIAAATGADMIHVGSEMIARGLFAVLRIDIETARGHVQQFFANVAAATTPEAPSLPDNVVALPKREDRDHAG